MNMRTSKHDKPRCRVGASRVRVEKIKEPVRAIVPHDRIDRPTIERPAKTVTP